MLLFRRVARLLLGSFLALGLLANSSVSSVRSSGEEWEQLPVDRFQAVDRYLQEQVVALGLPGVQFAAVENDKLAHLSAFGVADGSGRPMTPQTPVMLASTGKSLTAIAVMQQVDAGRLSVESPVKNYIPWFHTADQEKSARITVGHLLNHTSGFSTRDGRAYHSEDNRDPQALEQGVRELADVALLDEPGKSFTYSNLNYDVLGLLVQTVSGEDFARYMQRNVFTPLQMVNSYAVAKDAEQNSAAAGYYKWFGSFWRPTDMPRPAKGMPSATMYSSAEDLSHMLISQLSGGRYAEKAVVSTQSASALLKPTTKANDFSSYAMGWFARPMWETLDPLVPRDQNYGLPLVLEHNGEWSNTQTYLALIPGEGLGIALLVNGSDPSTPSLARAINSNVLRILHGKEPTPASIQEEPLQQYGWAATMAFFLAELAAFLATGRILYRWIRGTKVPSKRRITTIVIPPLLLDALALWLGLVYIPDHFKVDLPVILRMVPDAGFFLLPALLLAGGWGVLRTVLVAALWLRSRR